MEPSDRGDDLLASVGRGVDHVLDEEIGGDIRRHRWAAWLLVLGVVFLGLGASDGDTGGILFGASLLVLGLLLCRIWRIPAFVREVRQARHRRQALIWEALEAGDPRPRWVDPGAWGRAKARWRARTDREHAPAHRQPPTRSAPPPER